MEGGPSGFRPGFTCPALLRCQSCQLALSPTGLSPCIAQLSRSLQLESAALLTGPTTPTCKHIGLGSSHFARRYSGNLDLISFPLLTKMFQFGRSCFHNLCIQLWMVGDYPTGLPHSEISGSKLLSSSPKLIAGFASFIAC